MIGYFIVGVQSFQGIRAGTNGGAHPARHSGKRVGREGLLLRSGRRQKYVDMYRCVAKPGEKKLRGCGFPENVPGKKILLKPIFFETAFSEMHIELEFTGIRGAQNKFWQIS